MSRMLYSNCKGLLTAFTSSISADEVLKCVVKDLPSFTWIEVVICLEDDPLEWKVGVVAWAGQHDAMT